MKRKIIGTSIILSLLVSLLIFLFTFEPFCVQTVSNSYINDFLTNRIIDLIIDQDVEVSQSQLLDIKKEIKNSKQLYEFNRESFHQAVHQLLDINKVDTDEAFKELKAYCLLVVEEKLDYTLDSYDLEKVIGLNNYWQKMILYIESTIHSQVLVIYHCLQSVYLKIIVVLMILFCLFILNKNMNLKIVSFVCYFNVCILVGVLSFLILITPLLKEILNIEILAIPYWIPFTLIVGFIVIGTGCLFVGRK